MEQETMRKIDTTEIKKLSFEVLCNLKEVCENYHLNYSLTGGTLLGAVRHKGFIPWDDDIDVMLPRPDYDKLIQIAKEQKLNFDLYSEELNGSDYGHPFAKACHKETLVTEKDVKERAIKIGVYVDVFPVDGMGKSYKKAGRHFALFKIIHGLKVTSNWSGYHFSKTRKWYFEPWRYACYLLSKLIPEKVICSAMDRMMKKYSYSDSTYAGRLVGDRGKGEINKKSLFDNIIQVEFENEFFNAVADYDTFLTNLYGDYMKLPPVEKQVTHHEFEAFVIEK